MNMLRVILVFLCVMGLTFSGVSAGFFDDFISGEEVSHKYDSDEYGLDEGIEVIKDSLTSIETERSASEYIQDIVQYLLLFVSIIAVIYIMYAGFQILIGNGDEEKLKKSRTTIVYVIIGIVVIWLAWPITSFILNILNG